MLTARMREAFREYIRTIDHTRAIESSTSELSLHSALKTLLDRAIQHFKKPLRVIHEPTRPPYGRPDFIVMSHDSPIGYVEAEAYGCDLDHLPSGAKEQNERFIQNLGNFLQTNFTEFRLYQGGMLKTQVRLTATPTHQQVRDLQDLLEAFLCASPEAPATAQELATLLARRTRQLRDAILIALRHDKDAELINLHRAFSEVLLPDLSHEEFADLYAQTLAYGLFAGRLTHPERRPFVRAHASELIPQTNPFLRKLFHQISRCCGVRRMWMRAWVLVFGVGSVCWHGCGVGVGRVWRGSGFGVVRVVIVVGVFGVGFGAVRVWCVLVVVGVACLVGGACRGCFVGV